MNAYTHTGPFVGHSKKVICYLRPSTCKDESVQKTEIDKYCHDHAIDVTATYVDRDIPGPALAQAMQNLSKVDGMIVSDLNRFVEHADHRFRDLRPLLHKFLAENHKCLIAVEDGVDTSTACGQRLALEIFNELKDAADDAHLCWFGTPNR